MVAAEIERKFLLVAIPPREILGEGVFVSQGYLFADAGELRARRKGNQCFLTVKGGGSIARDEWEAEIPEWVFKTLWPKTKGRRVEKTRYSVAFGGLILEVDQYRGALAGLVILECEFPSEMAAREFVLPRWAESAVEVTNDSAYKNKNMAVFGLPQRIERR